MGNATGYVGCPVAFFLEVVSFSTGGIFRDAAARVRCDTERMSDRRVLDTLVYCPRYDPTIVAVTTMGSWLD